MTEAEHRKEINCKHLGRLVSRRIRNDPDNWTPVFKCNNPERGGECDPDDCCFCQLKSRVDLQHLPLIPQEAIPTPADERTRISQLAPRRVRTGSHPAIICNSNNDPVSLHGAFSGAGVFVTLTGPSLSSCDISKFNQRGIVTFGVNQSPSIHRPNFWTFVDPVEKFHSTIFRDPGITKFVPMTRYSERIRDKSKEGSFSLSELRARDCPNSFGVKRSCNFDPKTFFNQGSINWGNGKSEAQENGRPHILNVMFFVFGLCHHLGFSRIYLCGCDFSMNQNNPYAFKENKTPGACRNNNRNYKKLEAMFLELRPYFESEGITVRNATPNSNLKVFEYIDFDDAIDIEAQLFSNATDTLGYYIKQKERRADINKERDERRKRRKSRRQRREKRKRLIANKAAN